MTASGNQHIGHGDLARHGMPVAGKAHDNGRRAYGRENDGLMESPG
jgi:hypothetical protein